jgi:trigger factor
MNITQNAIDSLHGTIKVEVAKEDYAENVEKALKSYQRKAMIPGFRKGYTPFGIIKKMYGKGALLEELNKILSRQMGNFVQENQLHLIGEPLPSKEQKAFNIDEENHEMLFDIAYAPEMNVKLSKREKIPFYTIKIDDEMIDKEIMNILGANGEMVNVDTVEGTEYVKGSLVELEDWGAEKVIGIRDEAATMSVAHIKDEKARAAFTGAKVGSRVVFNPSRAYPNKTDLAAMLKISKEEAEGMSADFALTIREIKRYVNAEVNTALFDRLYGPGVVNSVEEFREKIKEGLQAQFRGHSLYRFTVDARDKMLKKNEEVALPEDFIKRWLVATDENVTAESVEKDFDSDLEGCKWQLVKNELAREYNLQVTEEDIKEIARGVAASQLQQYGLHGLTVDQLDKFAVRLLEDEKQRENLYVRAREEKIFACIREAVKLDEQEVSLDEFGKLFGNKN